MAKTVFDPSLVRTFALAGHRASGKTTLGDVLLHAAGVTRSIGNSREGTSLLDHDPSEQRRGGSRWPAFAWMSWEGHLLQMVDTPGGEGLPHERAMILQGVDAVVAVASATDGLEQGLEHTLSEAMAQGLPAMLVVNKMDRAPDAEPLLRTIRERTGFRPIPLQLPFFDAEGRFSGVVPLDDPRVLRYDPAGKGGFSPEPLPMAVRDGAAAAWDKVCEAVAETDDELLEQYLEAFELPVHVVRRALARAVRSQQLLPVVFAAAGQAMGAQPLLDAICWSLPSAHDCQRKALDTDGARVQLAEHPGFVAQVLANQLDQAGRPVHVLRVWAGEAPRKAWRGSASGRVARIQKLYQLRGPRRSTARYRGPGAILATWEDLPGRPGDTWTDGPQLWMAVPKLPVPMVHRRLSPSTAGAAAGLPEALEVLRSLDRGVEIGTDEVTGDPLLSGFSAEHLERAVETLSARLGVPCETTLPSVPYRECPSQPVHQVEGLHRRESDGIVSEMGMCVLDVLPVGGAPTFEATVDPDELPAHFVDAVEAGFKEGLGQGPLAGYPVVGLLGRCTGGEYDVLVSTEEHFRLAGRRAAEAALARSGTRLLEPWWAISVELHVDQLGDVISEIGGRRGRVTGMEVNGDGATLRAQIPYRTLRTFGPRLQSLTGGRGFYRGAWESWQPLPVELVAQVVAASPRAPVDLCGKATAAHR